MRKTDELTLGEAIAAAKTGSKFSRDDWTRVDSCGSEYCENHLPLDVETPYVVYQKGYPDGIVVNEQTAHAYGIAIGSKMVFQPYMQMFKHDRSCMMWTPSMEDLIATDYYLLEGK